MSSNTDPISKIFFITAKENLVSTQSIQKVLGCTQRGHNGDLYESSLFNKGKRYLCFEKDSTSDHLITDLLIVRDDEQVPNGYSGVFLTTDTNEKALKKHILCVKSEARQAATKAISDIVLTNQSKGERADPHFYTISHEVNEMNVTFRVDNITQVKLTNMQKTNSVPRFNEMPLQTAGQRTGSVGPADSYNHPGTATHATPKSPITGIEGVPFEMNPKFNISSMTNDPFMASIQILTIDDINRKFSYNFNIENDAVRKP